MKEHCNIQVLQDNIIQESSGLNDNLKIVSIEEYDPMADVEIEEIDTLTIDKLERATHVTYYFDSGSLPKEYHYSCFIRVERETVNVTVRLHYGSLTAYDETCTISIEEYENLIIGLAHQKICRIIYKHFDVNSDGSGSSYISIMNGKDTLFEGNVDYNGVVANSFFALLSQDMKTAVLNPQKFLDEYSIKEVEVETVEEIDWNNDLNKELLFSLNSNSECQADYINESMMV